jgi:hypothetical protein
MKTFEEPFDAAHSTVAPGEPQATEIMPDLAERLLTIERANLALDRARRLLERAAGLGPAETPFSGESNDEAG